MKKFAIIAAFLVTAVAVMAAYPLRAEPSKVTIAVPVTVHTGDSIDGICIELAEKYGDTRNYKEISYYAQKKNNVGRYIYPGQKLYIDLEVPLEQENK